MTSGHDLRYTLLADGTTDRALLPLLTWLLRAQAVRQAIQPAWADLGRLPRPPKKLHERIYVTIDLYPCEVLFVHRDAEREPLSKRVSEIREALALLNDDHVLIPVVCVVPVRMQEAWMLFDEAAIRRAAGNPRGQHPLVLPRIAAMESLPDPKETLHALLRQASGLSGRRLEKFSIAQSALRLAELIDDFAPLRALNAFQHLEMELARVIQQHGWDQ